MTKLNNKTSKSALIAFILEIDPDYGTVEGLSELTRPVLLDAARDLQAKAAEWAENAKEAPEVEEKAEEAPEAPEQAETAPEQAETELHCRGKCDRCKKVVKTAWWDTETGEVACEKCIQAEEKAQPAVKAVKIAAKTRKGQRRMGNIPQMVEFLRTNTPDDVIFKHYYSAYSVQEAAHKRDAAWVADRVEIYKKIARRELTKEQLEKLDGKKRKNG